ncbi:hypothetical protein ACFB49_46390 [Sphingomonas sp. DBB INV C78]|uniref:hypothetical protein n=1 Tax=Sphingomonas sp. DBB INV C78 TaxID=3349434 RepID=UPI0036D43BD7
MQVKILTAALAAMGSLCAFSSAAQAQDEAAEKWSVTITPRYQQLFFDASGGEGDAITSMPTYGGSVAVRTPDTRWGVMATYLTGDKKGDYEYDNGPSVYKFDAEREEYSLTGEYTPSETGITLLFGYRHFKAGADEVLTNPLPGNSETNSNTYKIDAAEIGFRLSSRLGVESSQSLSAQFTVGIGGGKLNRSEVEVFGTGTNSDIRKDSGTGYTGEMAIGYNIFLTNNLSLGARARAYIFYVDVSDADPIFALAPEANLSFRF